MQSAKHLLSPANSSEAGHVVDLTTSELKPSQPFEGATREEQERYELTYQMGKTAAALQIERARSTELESLAFYDQLTGIYNRRAFLDEGSLRIANAPPDSRFMVFFVDLDNFKTVNDELGHAVGDELLKQVAVCLQETLPHQTVARLGGDEFAILQKLITQPHHDRRAAQDIITATRNRCLEGAQTIPGVDALPFDISIGASNIYAAPQVVLPAMLLEADNAMYHIKPQRTSHVRHRD